MTWKTHLAAIVAVAASLPLSERFAAGQASPRPFYYGYDYSDRYVKDWEHDYWYDYSPRTDNYFGDPGVEYYPDRDPGFDREALESYDYLDADDDDFDAYDGDFDDFSEDGLAGFYSRYEGYDYDDDGFGYLSPGTLGPNPYGVNDLDEGYESGVDVYEGGYVGRREDDADLDAYNRYWDEHGDYTDTWYSEPYFYDYDPIQNEYEYGFDRELDASDLNYGYGY